MKAKEIVPLLAVKDMSQTLKFYVDGLGFVVKGEWFDKGVLRWCRLEKDSIAFMFQQFNEEGRDSRKFSDKKGEGINFCIFCDDAVEFCRQARSAGIEMSQPFISNGNWSASVDDPDGYHLEFESPAAAD